MNKRTLKPILAASFLGAILTAGVPAQAISFNFLNITGNGNPDVGNQLFVDVTAGGSGTVNFKFRNEVGIASSITDVYFDDGTLLAIASITVSGAGVAFSLGASPGNLPGANNASPPFNTTAGFSADSDPAAAPNGVNAAGEWVTINFTLQGTQTYADTLAALGDGSLRIGLRVQSIAGGGANDSDGYVNRVPVPDGGTTLLLLGSAMTCLGLFRSGIGLKL